ncbi:RidA family protein [Anaerotalea alkaliphila]|uniref:RidA family protein n=1 Tax=Anaerotalea alkaliphila TaxID=2662126 RepID=A0A7X5HUN8_9FIRM|nr:RidA family protein [Anaerotalea alkaliphila]NDL66746.1 RidA family protein [Anaerotalea alkaliphila]
MERKTIQTNKAPAAIGPYAQAVVVGDMLFASGQIPVDPATGAVPETIGEQTAQVFANIQAILAEAGLTLDNLVKTTVFLKDMNDFAAMNEVYASFFKERFPARSTVEVARLPKDVKVEIEAVASFR